MDDHINLDIPLEDFENGEIAIVAKEIFDNFNKNYCRLLEYCKKKNIDKSLVLKKAAEGEIFLYVFCEFTSTSNLWKQINSLDLSPYVIPFDNSSIQNSKSEIQLKVFGKIPLLIPHKKLIRRLLYHNNAHYPGFYEIPIERAQELKANNKAVCYPQAWHYIDGEKLDPPLEIEVEITLENVCIHEQEIKAVFPLADLKNVSPFLDQAYSAWQDIFCEGISESRVTIKKIIISWLKTKHPQWGEQERENVSKIIQPSKPGYGSQSYIKKSPSIKSKKNSPDHTFYAEELDKTIKIWEKVKPKNNKSLDINLIEKELEQFAEPGTAKHERLKWVLTNPYTYM